MASFLLIVACLWFTVGVLPAHAHSELVASDPAADAQLAQLPQQLTLTFNENVADAEGATVVDVVDEAGSSYIATAPFADGKVVTVPLFGNPSGLITVRWKVVSADGHPLSSEYTFRVTTAPSPEASATTEPAAGGATPEVQPTLIPGDPTAPTPSSNNSLLRSAWLPGFALIAVVIGLTALLYHKRS